MSVEYLRADLVIIESGLEEESERTARKNVFQQRDLENRVLCFGDAFHWRE